MDSLNKNKNRVKIIKSKIMNNPNNLIIFGLQDCPYSKESIKYSIKNNINYKFYNIEKYKDDFYKIINMIRESNPKFLINPTHKTFPLIFYNEKFIGGYSELNKMQ